MFFIVVVILFGVIPTTKAATTTLITQDEAIAWLESLIGKAVSNPAAGYSETDARGNYVGECASLGAWYYKKLVGYVVRTASGGTGNGNNFADNTHSTNLGWSKGVITSSTTLQKGDVIVWTSPENHVAIYGSGTPSSAIIYQQNANGKKYVTKDSWNLVGKTYVRPIWKSAAHTHSYQQTYEATHPHREFMSCSCGDWYYTGTYRTVSTCMQCLSVPTNIRVNNIASVNADGSQGAALSVNQGNAITISWGSVTNATKYRVEVIYWNGSTWAVNGNYTKDNLTSTSATYDNLAQGRWGFRVTAGNTSGWSSSNANWYMIDVNQPPPASAPTNLKVNNVATGSRLYVDQGQDITLTWNAVPGATKYRVGARWWNGSAWVFSDLWDIDVATTSAVYNNIQFTPGDWRFFVTAGNTTGWSTNSEYWYTMNVSTPPKASAIKTITAVTAQAQNYNFNINITNPTNGTLIIATYNNAGKLIETKTATITTTTTNIPLTMSKTLGATNAKIMIWDSLSTMQPLCESEIVTTLP